MTGMLVVREILGDLDEPRFAGRRVERLMVGSADAAKRRLRARTDAGANVAVDLERGSYLRHGAVLADDGGSIVVVERKPEEAMIVRLSTCLPPAERMTQAVRIGHAFGNQHVPLEVEGDEIRVPITTSREIAVETVRRLGLREVEISFGLVQLARERPSSPPAHDHGRTLAQSVDPDENLRVPQEE